MTQKIEPGCRCVIVNSEAGNDDIEVTALHSIGLGRVLMLDGSTQSHRMWVTDVNLRALNGAAENVVAEYHLKRIDDKDDEADTEAFKRFKDKCGIGKEVAVLTR